MKSKHKSKDELRDWMGRMHARCQVLESTPAQAASDAKASEAVPEALVRSTVADAIAATPSPCKACEVEGKKLSLRADGDLLDLLGHMRDRCEVLESTPAPATSDAKASDGNGYAHLERSKAALFGTPSPQKSMEPREKRLLDGDDLQRRATELDFFSEESLTDEMFVDPAAVSGVHHHPVAACNAFQDSEPAEGEQHEGQLQPDAQAEAREDSEHAVDCLICQKKCKPADLDFP
eukprot:CAMPEP_0197643282 /NCGR_PEP_ID=MMETSP1338-20131121/16661_1 /TAXON_ID=43686 ORGANISM="Pelagodinium beii, Strain RCC1491" /NCGR_SAMPLE_ID=MMETSP1338 /ASSEMBLY_ACC=CAM_ASM_000754 /LENGTH=234 /DNA_ID=CAMNT_0043216523 /DNA_START=52 /DNA_END=752 /DNA_ORIENTATION=+